MPRRKGHGISSAKRVQANKDDQHSKKKAVDNNEDPGGGRVPQPPNVSDPNAGKAKYNDISTDANSKYLHKKFKKMASLRPEEETVNSKKKDEANLSSDSTATAGRYVCPYCKLACAKPSVLQKHIRAHTNERPYPCRPCGFAFKTRSNLYKHCRSRAHSLKMEEEGISNVGANSLQGSSEDDGGDEEDEVNTSSSPVTVSAVSSSPTPTTVTNSNMASQVTFASSDRPRQIYKPKFHKAALYQEEKVDQEKFIKSEPLTPNNASFPPSNPSPEFIQRHISKIISKNQEIVETSDPQWPKKYQQRQRDHSSPASPMSSCSSPGIDATSYWPKKMYHRQSSVASQPEESDKSKTSKLALALLRPNRMDTSPSPRLTESPMSTTPELPSANCQQPLNLSTSAGNKACADSNADLPAYNHRKVSYGEMFPPGVKSPVPAVPYMTVLKDHNLNNNSITNSKYIYSPNSKAIRLESTDSAISLLDDLASATKNQRSDKLLFHPQNPEGSIIKGLLLKRRAAAAAAASAAAVTSSQSASFMNELFASEPATALVNLLPSEDLAYHGSQQPGYQFVCSLCKISYHSADNLNIHQLYYCKGENVNKVQMNSVPSSDLSPKINSYVAPEDASVASKRHSQMYDSSRYVKNCLKIDVKSPAVASPTKDYGAKSSNMVVPPFPSPGPLLGSTPLVDSYHQSYQIHKEDMEGDEQVEQLSRGPIPKKRRLDSDVSPRDASSNASSPDIRSLAPTPGSVSGLPSVTTLRSLEELSKCPMRANSLQMFGGEVQIIDAAGEMKTMRIEPSSRGDKSPCLSGPSSDIILNLPNRLNTGGILLSSGNKSNSMEGGSVDNALENTAPQIVVTIARSGLHSGGTLVVPHKAPVTGTGSPGTVKPPRSSGGSINCISIPSPKLNATQLPKSLQKNCGSSGGMMLSSPSPSSLAYTSSVNSAGCNTLTNVFPDTTKLLVPNITTPNLAVPGIPAPNLGHHLPFMHFPSILHDGTLLNPLTHITAFNPLTLPPASSIHLSNSPNIQCQPKELLSPSLSVPPRDTNPTSSGVVTIIHDGKEIPYVPGMPGPHTLTSIKKPVETKKQPSLKAFDLASPSKEPGLLKGAEQDSFSSVQTPSKLSKTKSSSTTAAASYWNNSSSLNAIQFQNTIEGNEAGGLNMTGYPNRKLSKNLSPLPSIKIDSVASNKDSAANIEDSNGAPAMQSQANMRKLSKGLKPDLKELSFPKEVTEKPNENNSKVEKIDETSYDDKEKSSGKKPKFLRPSTLPLKPGTFTPKKHHAGLTPTGMVLSLVSPETPRPKKSYGQLYLNGHAYTYLGLKCSARAYFCTLNRLQPMYVLLSPECAKVSMYSNWKVHSEATPHPLKLDPCQAMALYDSRHRPATYTIARMADKQQLTVTHSSYWLNKSSKQQKDDQKNEKKDEDSVEKPQTDATKEGGTKSELSENLTSGEPTPKRVKIFDGGFESNEEYTYVRGRGRGRYVCEECGIRCKKPSMLKKHIRTHTDVRPFTCKHCNFSFKTKGNLTKHMKSKAHYKKCIELGIVPVPTVVDDSYIDEERLARQQALRDSKLEDGDSDTDENDDEDEDEEEEEEDDDDEAMQLGDECDEANKGKLEREAACSLLSLSQINNSAQKGLMTAGLVPLHSCRPNTYPYSIAAPLGASDEKGSPLPPHTPTLSAVSAQTEREKVSHNTGLALGLGGEGMIVAPQQLNANRYYFPSSRASSTANTVAVPPSSGSLSGSWSDEGASDLEDSSMCESEISDSEGMAKREPVAQQPIDLSNKGTGHRSLIVPYLPPVNGARTPTTPISEILTPVSEPATLLASLCSSVERIPAANSIQKTLAPETTMLQAYLTERALQDVRMKQHQYHHNLHNNKHSFTISNTESLILPSNKVLPATAAIGTSISHFLHKIPKDVSKEYIKTSPSKLNVITSEASSVTMKENEFSPQEKDVSLEAPETLKIPKPSASSNISDVDIGKISPSPEKTKMSLNNCGIVRNVVVCGIPIGGQPLPSSSPPTTGNNTILNKHRTEFLPPSSGGPSPNYFGVTEDGRSICSTCNKTFSKPSQLRLHVNIHYFERPFRCESCAVSFRTKGHLQKHERSVSHQNKVSMNSTFGTPTTTNPRPFKCDDCKIAFRIHGHLAKHLRSKMHIMKLECVGKLPFGTYAEMEREGISLNEIDTTDCENSLESLQVLAQKLYDKDPSKLGQWDGERGEFFLPHPHLSGGDTSSDEGEPLPDYHSPQHPDQFPLQPSDSGQRQHLIGGSAKYGTEEMTTKARLTPSKQLSNLKPCEVRFGESPGKNYFRNRTVKLQHNTAIKQIINLDSGEVKQDQQASHSDSLLKEKSVVKEESNDISSEQSNQNMPTDLKFRILTSGNHSEMISVNHKDSSNNDGKVKRIQENRKTAAIAEGDYADDVEEDGSGTKKKLSCTICQMTFPDKSALHVHNFVEHDPTADISEDDSRQTGSSVDRAYATCRVSSSKNCNILENELSRNKSFDIKGHSAGDNRDSFSNDRSNESSSETSCAKFGLSPNKTLIYNSHEQYVKFPVRKKDCQSAPAGHNSPVLNLGLDVHQTVGKCVNSESNVEEDNNESALSDFNLIAGERMPFHSKRDGQGLDKTNSGSKLPWKKKCASNVRDVRRDPAVVASDQCQISRNKVQSLENDRDKLNGSAKIDLSDGVDVKSRQYTHCGSTTEDVGVTKVGGGGDKLNCDLCGKLQSSKESLQKHLLSHTQLRPFVCEYCDAGFTSQQLLQSHLEMHKQTKQSS